MDIAQISILSWTILTLIAIAILLRYEGAKLLLDVALVGLIIVLIWAHWHHNRSDKHDNNRVEMTKLDWSS
jgi:predicted branched-subunit amino acid permease